MTGTLHPDPAAAASGRDPTNGAASGAPGEATGLARISLAHAYRKGKDDIAREFYLPCHAVATSYDRAVGFFSSSVYALAWPSLRQFVERGGTIRLICSPVLSAQDQEALAQGHAALDDHELAASLAAEVRRMLAHPHLGKPTRVLASLVATGVVSIKLALLDRDSDPRSRSIFHDKVGLFRDAAENCVVFKGSMNETWAGLSADGNLESVDVYVSWGGAREATRVADEAAYFEALWEDRYPTVSVRQFPQVAREALIDSADPANWLWLVDEVCSEIELAGELSADARPGGRVPRPHQVAALREWTARDRRGILEHATGSGKTFTGLCAMRDALDRRETPLVLVPSELLMDQWLAEVHATLGDRGVQVLACDGRAPTWRTMLGAWTRRGDDPRVVVASMTTAASDDFLGRVRAGEHLFLLADEVHALGSRERRKVLGLHTGARLGLSATPRRAGDPEGTAALFGYFGDVVPPPFTLQDAVTAGALCPYFYNVHPLSLSPGEQVAWDEITNRIRQIYARGIALGGETADVSEGIRHLLLARARIVKRAEGKVPLAVRILASSYRSGHRWIIYCDARPQLEAVLAGLRGVGIQASAYHSALPRAQREETLAHLAALGGVVVAIKCLDEGVDIPAVDHALILASSKNPREFVQRRGRVLRRSPGKHYATVHDVLVVPNGPGDDEVANRLLAGELARAVEFGRGALNPSSITDIERLAFRFNFDLGTLAESGVEDDSPESDDE
ncbi:MAG TPA: DEAD/DEAH box helicase family protein [Longimicrobiaceae bacterium]|nr:DEAD/DEAH box helicase family protein [Longimicrobiaceae bacterium]